jgi:hypothetical protein
MRFCLIMILTACYMKATGWGFYAHQKINHHAVFLLPPEMIVFYKKHIAYITEHATDPDKRRYMVEAEGSRHYIDLDRYGSYPFDSLPRGWTKAVEKFGIDSLSKHGIVPWWIYVVYNRLVEAFTQKNTAMILKWSAEIGHYISDSHVPLHTSSNHNGQYTNQKGIHGFWESRIPELLLEVEWDLLLGKAAYVEKPMNYIWERVLESSLAADSVLSMERELTRRTGSDLKYSYEYRSGKIIRQYSAYFTTAFNKVLNGMVERRLRLSIKSVACFWYSAWIDAGQPDLSVLSETALNENEKKEMEMMNLKWREGKIIGREE